MRILIVEDDSDVAESVQQGLREVGYKVAPRNIGLDRETQSECLDVH